MKMNKNIEGVFRNVSTYIDLYRYYEISFALLYMIVVARCSLPLIHSPYCPHILSSLSDVYVSVQKAFKQRRV
jgi:hypothetical protein